MKDRFNILALLVCLVFFLISFFSVSGFKLTNLSQGGAAVTGDEVTYIASGYYSLRSGTNFLNPEHPHLVKDIAALPLFFIKPTVPVIKDIAFQRQHYPYTGAEFSKEGLLKNHQWDWGRLFLFNDFNNPDVLVFWARTAVLIFNTLLLFLVYFSLARYWNKRAAWLGLLLSACLPLSLAHAPLVILDFTSSLLQVLAVIWFSVFLRQLLEQKRKISGFLLFILFLSLALLTKSSSLVLLPVLFVSGLFYILFKKNFRAAWWSYLVSWLIAAVISSLFISTYYIPHIYKMDKADTAQQISYLLPDAGYVASGRQAILYLNDGNIFFRGLSQFMLGAMMNVRRADLSEQQMLYFMGQVYGRQGAGLKYYPILLLTKLPTAVLFLGLLTLIVFIKNYRTAKKVDLLFVLFAIYAAVFLLVALYFNLQMGLRYILPAILLFMLLCGYILARDWDRQLLKSLTVRQLAWVLLSVSLLTSLLAFPYYISYYNILAGGTGKGYEIAVDSNYDWGGQDIKKLAVWLEKNNINRVYAHLFTNAEPAYYLGDAYLPYEVDKDALPVSGSYVAISAHIYQTRLAPDSNLRQKYFNEDNLVARAGKAIFIFKMP